MNIQFLGTSSGTPTRSRNVSGIAVMKHHSKSWCLVDCGEGTQHQLLKTNLSLNNLDTIFITHMHGDHCYGLPGLLASATMAGRTVPLNIVGPQELKHFFNTIKDTTQLRLSYEINFINVYELTETLSTKEFDINTVALSHRVSSYAYVFIEKSLQRKLNTEKLIMDGIEAGPVWGQLENQSQVVLDDGRRINSSEYLLEAKKPRTIIVGGDNDTPALLKQAANSADVLIHEATYTDAVAEKIGPGPQHSSAKIVAEFAESSAIQNLILMHFSPRYKDTTNTSPSIEDIENEAKAYYRGHLFLANDLDIYHLQQTGEVIKLENS